MFKITEPPVFCADSAGWRTRPIDGRNLNGIYEKQVKKEERDSTARSILNYSSSNVFRRFLGVFTAFIKPKLLSPEMYGLWNLLNVIPGYATYLHLGARSSMRYQIPLNQARGDFAKNREIESSVYFGSLFPNLIVSVVLFVMFLVSDFNMETRVGFLTMALLILLAWDYDNYLSLLKSYQKFSLISSSNYLKASITAFFTISLIFFWGIYGVYLSALLSYLGVNIYLRARYPLENRNVFRFQVFLDLVKTGLPIMIFNVSSTVLQTSDRFIIAYFFGTEQLGYYGIAIMALGFISEIPDVAREVIEPQLMQGLADKSPEQNLEEYFLKPLICSAYLLPFIIGPAVIAVHRFIPYILPRYVPGIEAAMVIIIGSYFLSLSYSARGIIVANNWQFRASWIMLAALIVNTVLNFAFVKMGFDLRGVSLATSISFLLLLTALVMFIRRRCDYAHEAWRRLAAGIWAPFPVMCLALFFLARLSGLLGLNAFVAGIVEGILYAVIMLLLLIIARGQNSFLQGIKITSLWKRRR